MIQLIFFTVTITIFLDLLFSKLKVWDCLAKSQIKLLYKLSQCSFCKLFHLGWVSFYFCSLFDYLGILYILIPFVVSGVLKSIKYDSRN